MTKTNEAAEQAVAKTEEPKSSLALIKRDVVDVVGDRVNKMVESGQLQLPERYAVGNAISAWWLALQSCTDKAGRPALQVCTRDSIANATLEMIVLGLSPQKTQCYPIVHGNKLTCRRSYFGDESIVLRIYRARGYPKAKVVAEPIYKGDEFAYEIVEGQKFITKHEQKLENIVPEVDKIVGGYCIVYSGGDLPPVTIIRTIDQIKEAWKKSKTWKPGQKGSFHEDTPDHAVRRTVIRRACTEIINSSDDSDLAAAVREADQLAHEIALEAEIEEQANGPLIDLEAPAQEQGAAGNEPEPEPAAPEGLSEEEKAEIEAAESEPEDPPAARFQKLVDHLGLDPTKAKRAAADSLGLDDLRRLGSAEYESILADPEPFLERYRKAGGKVTEQKAAASASQGTLGGPDW